jgi:hypothetical protein
MFKIVTGLGLKDIAIILHLYGHPDYIVCLMSITSTLLNILRPGFAQYKHVKANRGRVFVVRVLRCIQFFLLYTLVNMVTRANLDQFFYFVGITNNP